MKHYQCFLRRHSDGGRVLIMKISYIVIGVFGFLVFISFVIACVGIEIQFGKRIEQKGPKMVIPDWIHQKEVEFVSGKNKLKGYIFWNAKDNKLSEKIIVLVHGYGVTYKDYEIEIEEFVKRKYSVFAYDMTGCGMSQGKKIGGFSQFLLDAQSAIKYVATAPAKKLFSFDLKSEALQEFKLITKIYFDQKLEKEYKIEELF